jgi:hypothetical protein
MNVHLGVSRTLVRWKFRSVLPLAYHIPKELQIQNFTAFALLDAEVRAKMPPNFEKWRRKSIDATYRR